MKNVAAIVLLASILGCGADGKIAIKPDPTGNGGNGGSGGSMGNSNGGSDAGLSTCDCPSGDGTRLSRQYVIGDDDSRMESPVWYDKDLDLKCSFQSLPNGQTYCVPLHSTGNTYFDAGCVIPAYEKDVVVGSDLACLKLPSHVRYGFVKPAGLCGSQGTDSFTMFRVNPDKLIARSDKYYQKTETGSCESVNVGGGGFEAAMWEVLEIGPLNKFVKAVQGVGF